MTDRELVQLRAEVDAQQAQARHAARRLVEVTAERDRLLAEKRNLVARNRLLRERTDLPLEYSEAHDRLVAERDRLLAIVARMLRSRVTVRLGIGRWSQHGRHLEPIDPADLALIREALGRKDHA